MLISIRISGRKFDNQVLSPLGLCLSPLCTAAGSAMLFFERASRDRVGIVTAPVFVNILSSADE